VRVIREPEIDWEVAPMYAVRFDDGEEFQVHDDELTKRPRPRAAERGVIVPPRYQENPAGGVRGEEQGISPLTYRHTTPVLRYGLVDEGASPPPPSATYFAKTSYKQRRNPETGREWKTPRIVTVPGAKAGTVAFVDWHPCGYDCLYIDYLAVRSDLRGQHLASALMRSFFRDIVVRHEKTTVDWGDMMEPQIGALKKAMEKLYPAIRQYGKAKWGL
jgi:hypothetical protein